MIKEKIFIIGLPRTATTSVCVSLLSLGVKTAHTVYTQKALSQAQAIADTPIYCDYQQLDIAFPSAKFVLLTRPSAMWLPSIKQLLNRMYTNLQRADGGFNPILKRCYNDIFSPLTIENIQNDAFLLACYQRHHQGVLEYFADRKQDLLTIDVSHIDSYAKLVEFIQACPDEKVLREFEKINIAGKVTAWNKVRHPLKVESTQAGRVESLIY